MANKYIYVSADTKNIVIDAPYDERMLAAFREIDKRKFDTAAKVHRIPIDHKNFNKIVNVFPKKFPGFQFIFEDSIKDLSYHFDAIREKLAKIREFVTLLNTAKQEKRVLTVPGYDPPVESMDHQIYMMILFLKLSQCAFFSDMGTGKTKASIDCFDYLYKQGRAEKVLVVCKLPAINNVWIPQIKRFSSYRAYNLRNSFRDRGPGFYVINTDVVNNKLDQIMSHKFDAVIVDESHRIGNIKSARTKAMLTVRENVKYRIALTGTPKPNKYDAIFSQFLWLDGGEIFGTSLIEYYRDYFKQIGDAFRQWWVLRKGADAEINDKMILRSITYKSEECLTLPPEQIIKIPIELTTAQKKAINDVNDEAEAAAAAMADTDDPAAVKRARKANIMKMRMIASGFIYTYKEVDGPNGPKKVRDGGSIEFENNKIPALIDLIEEIVLENENKVIIWTNFEHEVEMISKILKALKIQFAVCAGDIDSDTQDQELERIRNGKTCFVLIASMPKAAESLDLPFIQYNIYFSNSYDWGQKSQSMKRTRRKGCEVFTHIFYYELITANSIEIDIMENLEGKGDEHNFIMNYGRKKYRYEIA